MPLKSPTVSRRSLKLYTIIGFILLAIGLIVNIFFSFNFDFTQDDAFITFRYAENFVNGHGLVYNIGERVEGYTNFLWLILMILGRIIGFEYVLYSKIIGLLFGLGTIMITYLFSRKIFEDKPLLSGLTALLLGSVYSFAYWSIAGLETSAFTFCLISSFFFYDKKSLASPLMAALSALFRPEGMLAIIFLLTYEIISNKRLTNYVFKSLAVVSLLLIPYAVFKIIYFGALLPNPFYAKTDFTLNQLVNGWEYVSLYFYHYVGAGLFILPALIYFKKLQAINKILLIFLLIYTLYIMFIGGDVLKVHRFFVPIMPFIAITIVYGLFKLARSQIWITCLVIGIIGWQLYFPYKHVSTFYTTENQLNYKMNIMAEQLLMADSTNFTVAASTIGLVGYRLIDHTLIDLLGLTDSVIARHPEEALRDYETTWKESKYNAKYVLSRKPDYILFSTGFKPSAPAEMALFTYSQFLKNYRTMSFFFADARQSFYKKFYPIEGNIESDVNPNFVSNYVKGVNQGIAGNYKEASNSYRKALQYEPEFKYPYIYYQLSAAKRGLGDYDTARKLLLAIVERDSLIFPAYDDLFVFALSFDNNVEQAEIYKQKILTYMPWEENRLNQKQIELIRQQQNAGK